MKSSTSICASVLAFALSAPLAAQQPAATVPEEKVQVTVVQIDALVVDKEGKTVPGLTKGDFSMTIAGAPIKISTVDLVCPIGAAADPVPIKDRTAPPPAPIAPGVKRRVVFAFDYSFLDVTMRRQVLEAAETLLRMSKTDDEEVMIVALASGVRVEQKFTKDIRQLAQSLSRMQHDVTLWARDFPIGSTGRGYFGSFSTLMDVLGSYDGPKAVVLFSQASSIAASMRDLYINDVAAHAAAARAAIYPAMPDMLDARGAGDTLVRLASQTGGRYQTISNDISLPYRRAQRDLSCRYTVAAYVDPKAKREPQTISVALSKPDASIRTPAVVQIFSDEAKKQSRAGAAYVDPGPFEHPLVRALAFSAVPAGANKWDTLLAVNFPAPVGPAGVDIDVRAIVRLNKQDVDDYKRRVHVDPAPNGATSRVVTLMGDTPLKEGQYELTVVLSKPGGDEIVSAQTDFVVPAVINDVLILRGPITGRVLPGGLFLRANPKEQAQETRLGKMLGPGNGFEPLLIEEIDKQDKLLFYWSACVSGRNPLPGDAVVARTIVTEKGEPAHAYTPVPLKLESRGKDVSCLDMLESLPPGTLASGDYRVDVTVTYPNGDVIAQGSQPLTVR
jgi:VWFA-related protein